MIMKEFNGYNRYRGLIGIEMKDMPKVEIPKPVKSQEDIILDSIFCLDENGWPCTSFAKVMSNKTSDEIRKYIQDNIMVAKSVNHMISDDNVLQEFKKLDSEFLAAASRNRFESIEAYEERISNYIETCRAEKQREARFQRYKSFFKLDEK